MWWYGHAELAGEPFDQRVERQQLARTRRANATSGRRSARADVSKRCVRERASFSASAAGTRPSATISLRMSSRRRRRSGAARGRRRAPACGVALGVFTGLDAIASTINRSVTAATALLYWLARRARRGRHARISHDHASRRAGRHHDARRRRDRQRGQHARLLGGGGVDGAIHRAAGPDLLAECRTPRRLRDRRRKNHARLSASRARTSSTRWDRCGTGCPRARPDLLASCYSARLELAVAHRIASIAFPAISCGAYGYPLSLAVPIAVAVGARLRRARRSRARDVRVHRRRHARRVPGRARRAAAEATRRRCLSLARRSPATSGTWNTSRR